MTFDATVWATSDLGLAFMFPESLEGLYCCSSCNRNNLPASWFMDHANGAKHKRCIPCEKAMGVFNRLASLDKELALLDKQSAQLHRIASLVQRRNARQKAHHASLMPIRIRRRQEAQRAIIRLRPKVIARTGYICGICGDLVAPNELSIDHKIPITRGGSDDIDNLQVAHRVCNSRKNNRVA